MTTLREAAQQALDALESAEVDPHSSDAVYKAITALRAALAEPVQQGCDHCNHPMYAAIKCRVCGRVTEPVAWMLVNPKHPRLSKSLHWKPQTDWHITWESVPLYTAPPQRKPEPNSDYERGFVDGMSEQARRSVDKAVNAMTKCKPLAEEEIARLVTNDMVKFARAIERAHGIKE